MPSDERPPSDGGRVLRDEGPTSDGRVHSGRVLRDEGPVLSDDVEISCEREPKLC